jgi:DNA-directed RNA polymerase subunit omega
VSGTAAAPEGITNPPIDELLAIAQLGEGLLEYVGPLVETHVHEKPLSIAMREINGGLLTAEPIEQV